MKILKNKNKLKINDNLGQDYIIFKEVFNKKEVKKIKKFLLDNGNKYKTTFSNEKIPSSENYIYSYMYDFYNNKKNKKFIKKIYFKLNSILNIANERYKFNINGMNSKIVMNEMKENTNIKFHKDLSSGLHSLIKIAGILSLTSIKDYEGGEFNILNSPYNEKKFEDIDCYTFKYKLDLGDIILFPSYIMHGVNTVKKGNRFTVVFSLEGDAFK